MIELTRLSILQRVIVAGSDRIELCLALKRAAAPATWRMPHRQHSIGLIAGHDSLGAVEGALAEISPFLYTNAAVAVLIDSRDSGSSLEIRTRLQQMGFRLRPGSGVNRALCRPPTVKASANW
jgi:hypothetical protein